MNRSKPTFVSDFVTFCSLFCVVIWSLLAGCDDVETLNQTDVDLRSSVTQGNVTQETSSSWWLTGTGVPTIELLTYLNDTRDMLNLKLFSMSPELEQAAQSHAATLIQYYDQYMAEDLSVHEQSEDMEGFIGVKYPNRHVHFGYEGTSVNEVIAFKPSEISSVRSWLESLYHRLPLLDPATDELGYGESFKAELSANVLELGRMDPEVPQHRFVHYPATDAEDVAAEWDGNEVPQPQPPPKGYPSGPVITLQSTFGRLSIENVSLNPAKSNALAALTILTAENDARLPLNAAAFIPEEPLNTNTLYDVEVSGIHDGQPFTETWSFTTAPPKAGCNVLEQDCGPGQGCYILQGEPKCLWASSVGLDEPCYYTNGCAAGLACLGARCRPYCDASAEALGDASCLNGCPGGTIPASLTEPDLAVCLAESCSSLAEGCGDVQGCYWSGGFYCDWVGSGQSGEGCLKANDCANGLSCVGTDGTFSCAILCGDKSYPSCDSLCGSDAQILDEDLGVSYCF